MRHSVSGGVDVEGMAHGTEGEIARFVTGAIADGSTELKQDWREQIEAARLGPRLARTVRSRVYPQGQDSVDAAGLVWTKAPRIIDAYARGATIVARNGAKFLAIPTAAAPRLAPGLDGQNRRITPDSFERATGLRLGFVSRGFNQPALLVVEGGRLNSRGKVKANRRRSRGGGEYTPLSNRMTVVVFVLVRRVKVSKRLDLDSLAHAAEARHPDLLNKHWR